MRTSFPITIEMGTPSRTSLVHRFINTPTYSSGDDRLQVLALIELAEKFLQVLACELPIKGSGRRFPVVLKVQQPLGEDVQIREIIRGENLSLHDRKVNFDLIEPTGVSGCMDKLYGWTARILLAQAFHSTLPAMHRTVVHDPEDSSVVDI